MLFRCNLLALIGGGEDSAFENTKVILWDDNKREKVGELNFKSEVKSVRLRKERYFFH
jgi:WD repeat-containing protein 45